MKRKRILIAGAAAAVAALILLALSRPKPAEAPRPAAPPPASFDVGIPTAQEVRNMLGVYGERVEATEREIKALRTDLEETRKQLKETVAALQTEQKKDLSIVDAVVKETKAGEKDEKSDASSPSRFKTFEFPREGHGKRSLHIPAGSFGEATLLTGVYAPITGEALPVLLRLDAALIGPTKSRVPIRHAFLVGKAQGEANSRRAVVQLETLSLVTESGETVETKVNGWVVDNDGIQGLSGTYIWRADEIAGLAIVGGGMQGVSEALAANQTQQQITPLGGFTQIVTGDHLKFAGSRGVGGASQKLSEILTQRLNEITPAIYVTNGQRVTVAFITGATLEGMSVPETKRGAYDGLDHD